MGAFFQIYWHCFCIVSYGEQKNISDSHQFNQVYSRATLLIDAKNGPILKSIAVNSSIFNTAGHPLTEQSTIIFKK